MRDYFNLTCHNSKLRATSVWLGYPANRILAGDVPAGYSCPGANICRIYSNRHNGKITRTKSTVFDCFAARSEALAPTVRLSRWSNFDLMRNLIKSGATVNQLVDVMVKGLERYSYMPHAIRPNSAGDYFHPLYFKAWMEFARQYPNIVFYGYTKVLPVLVDYRAEIPANVFFVYSWGGKWDADFRGGYPVCYVVNNEQEAESLGVPMAAPRGHPDYGDDYMYIINRQSFAIHVH